MGTSRRRSTQRNQPPGKRSPGAPRAAEDGTGLTQLTAALAAQQGLPLVPARPVPVHRVTSPRIPAPRVAGPRVGGPAVPAPSAPSAVATDDDRHGRAVPAEVVSVLGGCEQVLEGDAIGLAATYCFDSGDTHPGPDSVAVRFVGRRVGADGTGDARDRFDQIERVDGLVPGSGPVTITTKVVGIHPGQWRVLAEPVRDGGSGPAGARPASVDHVVLPAREVSTRTGMAALLHGPGVRPFAWPVLVLIGVLVALVGQAVLLARIGAGWGGPVVVSAVAVAVGYLAAKTWYLVLHRQSSRTFVTAGTCIQGFLLGTFATVAIASTATATPVGLFLDASTPGLFLAMAVGRPGCFLGAAASGDQPRRTGACGRRTAGSGCAASRSNCSRRPWRSDWAPRR